MNNTVDDVITPLTREEYSKLYNEYIRYINNTTYLVKQLTFEEYVRRIKLTEKVNIKN